MAHDIVIRGGNIVDGTGAEPVSGDVAINDGLITAVGKVAFSISLAHGAFLTAEVKHIHLGTKDHPRRFVVELAMVFGYLLATVITEVLIQLFHQTESSAESLFGSRQGGVIWNAGWIAD